MATVVVFTCITPIGLVEMGHRWLAPYGHGVIKAAAACCVSQDTPEIYSIGRMDHPVRAKDPKCLYPEETHVSWSGSHYSLHPRVSIKV